MKPLFTSLIAFCCIASSYAAPATATIPPPLAQFNASSYSGCAPLTVTFYNSSEGNGTYSWNFGDINSPNNTSIACSPTHTFMNPGSYLVTLTYFYNNTFYTDTATIRVWPLPNPAIAGDDTSCAKAVKTYTASGFAGSSYYWTVTGGTIVGPANTASVNVHWTTPGVGMLTVNETTIHGCTKGTTAKILVAPQPELGNFCSSRKDRPSNPGHNDKPEQLPCKCENSITTFQALGPDNFTLLENDLYTFQWTVTGGTIVSGSGTNSIQVLVGPGPSMSVSVVVFNAFGCTDSGTCVFDVCKAPIASFKADTACFTSATYFNASQSSVQAQINSYSWDFGDNTSDVTLTNYTSHLYGAPGIYWVKLTVTNTDGCEDDTLVPVWVKPGDAPPITCLGTVCHNTRKCYQTPWYPGAVYQWTVTGNALPPAIQGDTSICITWGSGPVGTITLEVTGGPYTCGKTTVSIPIFPSSIAIYGPDTVCTGGQFNYSTDLIPGSCYSWSIKNPANVSFPVNPSNNPGNQIIRNVPNVPGTYEITLNMNNDLVCCHGSATKKVVVQSPIQVFGPLTLCEYDSGIYFSSVPVSWSVSNGTISASTPNSCVVHWGAASYGTITATALNPDLVCDNTATFAVTLMPKPDALPINGNTLVCVGSTEMYTHDPLAAGVTSTFSISPNTGFTVINPNPLQVTFNVAGNYVISAVYVNTNGCSDTSQLTVTVMDTLKPVISGPLSVCKGSTHVYTLSSNPGNAWQWNAIGGQILYQSPDSLIINWGNINQGQVNIQNTLCGGFTGISITINQIPNGIITVGNPSCKGDTVRLSGPPGYTYLWNTAATTQSILATNPSTSFWVIIGQNGCFDTLYKSISPFPKLPKPNVNISYNCMLAPSTPVPYEMTATYNANWHYSWSPVTAIPSNSDTTNTHYSTVFNSTHTVIVTNEFGCKDTASVQLTTPCVDTCAGPGCGGSGSGSGTPCTATFTVQYNPCSGMFSFTQLSGNTIIAVLWNFNDGDYSNNFGPQHYFATTGTHAVTLSVYCGNAWITQTFNISVPYILLPKIKHSFPVYCDYNTITLSHATGSVVLGATSQSVDWGQGPLTFGSLPQNHTYTNADTFLITYTVSAPGCTRILYDTVIILPFRAAFGFCDSGCVGQAVQFVDHSTSPAQYPIVQWDWDFGDLSGSNLQSPFHIYNSTGIFSPQLVIQNQQGCKDSITLNIVITNFNAGALTFRKNGVPIALPGNSTFNICEGDYIEAEAPPGVSYTYAWNNGISSQIDTITQTGMYKVVISNGRGCTDTLGPFYVVVNPLPIVSIIASDTFCQYSLAKLSALPGPGYVYNWTSNPPLFIFGSNPTYFPTSTPGNYMVTLQVINLFGCTASDSQMVNVTPAPLVTIIPGTTAQLCEGDSLQLTAVVTGAYVSGQWNNGDTALSIWVRSNGTYSYTVANAFGCTFTGQYQVTNIGERPDLSNVPKGCYKVCGKTGVGAVVCGPYPKPGQTLYYTWYHNGGPVSTNQNISITASGDYHILVKDSATGCTSLSAPFNVQYTSSPVANILSSSPNPTLCIGIPGNIGLQADSISNDVVYTWFLNGVPVATGTSYNATVPGTYTLVAYFSECCNDTDKIVIVEGDCCFPPGTDFKLIQDSTVISTHTVWDGKYYVAGKVYVTGSAILDMTEIDVVFDRDGEIIFRDTSVIRATNSVFRPCDMYDAWQGISFYDHSHGFVQANNFKSADSAIWVNTYGKECVKLNDNFFGNCHVGIAIARQQAMPYNQAITNNSFVVDNYNFNTPALYNSNEFWGIRIFGTKTEELISHNQFRSSDFTAQNNQFYGIWGIRSSGTLSENKFSNIYRGIDWTLASSSTFIENNEFEQTNRVKFPNDYQIRLSDCTQPVLVFANEFRNSDNFNQGNTAIYAQNMALMNIRDNNIKGFQFAIYTLQLNQCMINENDVDNAGRVGIFDSDSRNTSIHCNIVRMKDYKTSISPGLNFVGIHMANGDASNRIYSNCVFDTRYAILVRSTLVNTIPLIHNNYLYNYLVSGIRTINHTGNIGSLASPGKNTFVSNNRAGGAVDIFGSGGAVVEFCNFGILSIGGTASTGGACPANLMYSSTAACGHQIVNTKYYKTDQWDLCDIFNDNLDIIVKDPGAPGNNKDSVKTGDFGNLVVKNPSMEALLGLSYTFMEQDNPQPFSEWITALEQRKVLPVFYTEMLRAEWIFEKESRVKGLDRIQSLRTENEEESALKQVVAARMKLQLSLVLTPSEQDQLSKLDQARGRYAAMARDLVHYSSGKHDYLFDSYPLLQDEEMQVLKTGSKPFIQVHPNPANQSVMVYFQLEHFGNHKIYLTDLSGRKLSVNPVNLEEGKYSLNLSNLSRGLYFVVIEDAVNFQRHTAKLIKE